MNPLDQVQGYLRTLETRLRWTLLSRGLAYTAIAALVATVLLVLLANAYAFSEPSVYIARFLLFVCLAVAIALGLVIPIAKLNGLKAARHAEATIPDFKERLLTFTERVPANDPFLELLAADTMSVASAAPPESVVHSRLMFAGLGASGVATIVLLWLILAGPGFMGHGASLLWAGTPRDGNMSFYDIIVTPGNKTVRRKADQMVSARMMGFQPQKVLLFARYNGTTKWEQVPMMPAASGNSFEFLFAGLPDSVEYYVSSGGIQSKHYNLTAVDLASVKKIKVTYHYPSWAGMKAVVDEASADLRAVEGTEVDVEVLTDKPLARGALILDDGQRVDLKATEGNWLTAHVRIEKDGMYHVAALEKNEDVRLSEDFFIEAQKETPPTVKIDRPARDAKVNPIEEVTVGVTAQDDFALQEVALHYSVNGAPEKVVQLLPRKGMKTANGQAVIALEDYKMQPGDMVSMYATANDARSQAKSDIVFIEAQPFSREYSQSQESGGGGGGGDMEEEGGVSQRQKEIIAATFNQIRDRSGDKSKAQENSKFLSEVQSKLEQQSRSLARRMGSRGVTGAGAEFQTFSKEMQAAADSMVTAAERLKSQKWNDAMPDEQKALQHLLRAEATMREIKVAFGRNGGGGGGGGASRELQNLFDLELDTEKNQYETGQRSSGEQRAKEIDEALQKLKELARRQEELAQQQQNSKQQAPQQRWQQEMLRREAEELKRQMQQLAQQNGQQGQQSQSSQQSGQQSASSQGQSGQQSSQQSGQQSSQQSGQQQQASSQRQSGSTGNREQDRQLQQAIDRLTRAVDDMRKASGGQAGQQQETAGGSAESRRAAERLKEAGEILHGLESQESGQTMDDLVRRTEQLAQEQQRVRDDLKKMFPANTAPQLGQSRQQADDLASEKDKMAEEVRRLEQDMQNAVRNMSANDRKASSKLREALGEVQQKELQLRLRYGAKSIRDGYGAYMAPREDFTSTIVNNLRDQVKQAQQSMANGGKPGSKGDTEAEQALSQVEKARRQLEAMAQSARNGQKGGRNGQQNGQPNGQNGQQQDPNGQQSGQQAGQNGQQPGQGQQSGKNGQQQAQNGQQGRQPGQGQQPGEGQQPGQQGQQGQSGQGQQGQGQQPGDGQQPGQQSAQGQAGRGGQQQGAQPGQIGGQGGAHWGPYAYGNRGYYPDGPGNANPETAYRDAMRSLQELRQMLQANPDLGRELGSDVQNILRDMQKFDARQMPGNPAVIDQVQSTILPNVQQLELLLRRKVEGSGDVRSAGSERIPTGYADAVAEYFRRLSKAK